MHEYLCLRIRDEHGWEQLTPWLVEQLLGALEVARPSDPTRVLVVTLASEGAVFCDGMDPGLLAIPTSDAAAALARFAALLHAVECAPHPVVALVDGPARGGGAGLAAAADVVLATPRASFSLPEALIGLVPAMVFPLIARRMGSAHTRMLALGAASLSAAEACRLGLVDEVTDDLEAALARRASRLGRMDPRALAEVKAMAAVHADSPKDYPAHALGAFQRLLRTPETRARLERLAAGDVPWPEESAP